jgi:hypothetical protein
MEVHMLGLRASCDLYLLPRTWAASCDNLAVMYLRGFSSYWRSGLFHASKQEWKVGADDAGGSMHGRTRDAAVQ